MLEINNLRNKVFVRSALFFVFLASILVFPEVAFGQAIIEGIIGNILSVVAIIGTAIVVIMWVITGLLFLSALGEPTKLDSGKKALFASIGGTVLVILAWSAANIISNILFFGR